MNMYPIELYRQHEASQVVRARLMNPEKVRSAEIENLRTALQAESDRADKARAETDALKGKLLRQLPTR